MKTIRNGVFETNSSSCHVLTLMSAEDRENLLNHEAILYFSGHAGPEEDMLTHVLTHDEFVQQFFSDVREYDKCNNKKMRKEFEEPIKKILEQFWKDFVTETDNNTEQFYTPNGNTYCEYKYTQLPEWNELTEHDIKFIVKRKLKFTQPDYTAEELLENAAELKLKHDTAYAVSWEKDY